jgi:hypothetical protein
MFVAVFGMNPVTRERIPAEFAEASTATSLL